MEIVYKNCKVHFEVVSDGEPILYLHGWGCSGNDFAFAAAALEKNQHILIDFPPFGQSDEMGQAFDLDDYVSIVILVLNVLNLKRVSVVAHSFGGRVALVLASKFGSRVERLILCGCAGLKNKSLKLRLKKLKIRLLKSFKISTLKYQSPDYRALSPIMKKTFSNIVERDLKCELAGINCEVLLIWGEFDTETPLRMARVLKRKIKNAELIIFKKCNHFCFAQQPNLFIMILRELFK